jgi:hypothetical protein
LPNARESSDLINLIRRLSFQAIVQAFESSDYETIDANRFVREKTERFVVYCGITLMENIAEEVMNDHELPAKMSVAELIHYLGPGRISRYKKLWAQDDELTVQHTVPQQVYQHWRGEVPRNWDTIQFATLLSTSLTNWII